MYSNCRKFKMYMTYKLIVDIILRHKYKNEDKLIHFLMLSISITNLFPLSVDPSFCRLVHHTKQHRQASKFLLDFFSRSGYHWGPIQPQRPFNTVFKSLYASVRFRIRKQGSTNIGKAYCSLPSLVTIKINRYRIFPCRWSWVLSWLSLARPLWSSSAARGPESSSAALTCFPWSCFSRGRSCTTLCRQARSWPPPWLINTYMYLNYR